MRRIAYVRVLTGVCVVLCAFGGGMVAQGPQQDAPTVRAVNQTDDPLLKRFVWRSIGPVAMGGRIDDVAVLESDPSTFYLGYATGGVWKTENNGTTFASVFDEYPVSSIGDIAIAPSDRNIIYVGTGEPNNRQSSSFGGGVFKSTDAGKKFAFVGLKETQTIAKIAIHPKDPEHGLRRGSRAPVRTQCRAWDLQDDRRREGLGARQVHRPRHRLHRHGHAPVGSQCDLGGVVSAPPPAVGVQRRWSGEWNLAHGRTQGRPGRKSQVTACRTIPIIGRIGLDICRSKPNVILAQIEVGPSGGAGAGVNEDGSLAAPSADRLDLAAAAVALPRPHPIRRRAVSGDPRTAGEAGGS